MNKLNAILKMIVIAALLSTAACATSKIEKEKIVKIRSAAIIGFDLEQQKPVSAGDLLDIATKNVPTGPNYTPRTESAHVDEAYTNAVKEIQTSQKWKVQSLSDLKNNPAYVRFFKSKTEGFQTAIPIENRFTLYQATGVLDSYAILTTEKEKLAALQKDLGVDALIIVHNKVNLNNSGMMMSLIGKGTFSPSATTTVTIQNADEKIYFESVEGSKIKSGEKNFLGMAADEKINILSVRASKSSVEMLFNGLRQKVL